MKKTVFLLLFACLSVSASSRPLGKWVDPFIGTDYTGHTCPAAACPLGMVQPGPQSGNYLWKYCSGYNWSDSLLVGFTQNRLSGTGVPSLCNVLVMPFSDSHRPDYASRKAAEKASPGHYAVDLPDNGASVDITCYQLTDAYGSQGEQIQHTNFAQHGDMSNVYKLRGGYSETWTVFWITAHFLNAAARFIEAGEDI